MLDPKNHDVMVSCHEPCLFSCCAKARGAIVTSQPCRALGADEYLCLQAVHALATAITNGFKGGETQLGVAADSQGMLVCWRARRLRGKEEQELVPEKVCP